MKLASIAKRLLPAADEAADASGADGAADPGTPWTGGTDAWAVHDAALARIRDGEDIVLLSIGQEAAERTPPAVVEAACASLRRGRHHYVPSRGELALREALGRRHAMRTGQHDAAPAERCTVFSGAQNALFALGQLLLEPGDEVILVAPCYTTYPATFSASGATLRWVVLERERGYAVDAAAVIAAMTSRTRLVVLNTPNNPLGTCWPLAALERVLEAVAERDAALVIDSVYAELYDDDALAGLYRHPAAATSLVSVGSLSKSHRMTGWRVGWAIAPEPLSTLLGELCLAMHYGLPPFVQDAALAALEDAADTPATVRAALAERRAAALGALVDLEPAKLIDSGEGMFMLLDVHDLGVDARTFAFELLERRGVSVLPCDGFGPGARHLVRIGLCVAPEAVARAARAIVEEVARRRDLRGGDESARERA